MRTTIPEAAAATAACPSVVARAPPLRVEEPPAKLPLSPHSRSRQRTARQERRSRLGCHRDHLATYLRSVFKLLFGTYFLSYVITKRLSFLTFEKSGIGGAGFIYRSHEPLLRWLPKVRKVYAWLVTLSPRVPKCATASSRLRYAKERAAAAATSGLVRRPDSGA